MTNKLQIFVLIALLAHLLLYLSFSIVFHFSPSQPEFDKPIETYIYHEEKNNPLPHPILNNPTQNETPTSPHGIEKPVTKAQSNLSQSTTESVSLGKGEQNINLKIKSKNSMEKPLLNILTKATARHLTYPKIAVDFHLTGTVVLGFTISPDGSIHDISVIHSSGTEILDNEAMAAVRAASPLKNISTFLTAPENFTFQIVFQA